MPKPKKKAPSKASGTSAEKSKPQHQKSSSKSPPASIRKPESEHAPKALRAKRKQDSKDAAQIVHSANGKNGKHSVKAAKSASTPISVIDQPDVQDKLRDLIRLATFDDLNAPSGHR
jgi:RNA polymerase primary sigma factor